MSNDFPNVNYRNGNMMFQLDSSRFAMQNSLAQKWLDNQVLTDCTPMVRFRDGDLRKSGISGTQIGSGEVCWNSPYARYQYYGKVMVGPPPKEVTDIDINYKTEGTGAFWFEDAKSANKIAWINGVKKIGGGS